MSDGTPQQKITYIGKIDYRDKQLTFGIKERDRTKHTYIIGKSGMGKSTLLENLIIQDINNGEGVCVIDPHGSLAETILHYIPESRIKDVVYFAPFDGEFPMGLNMLEKVSAEKRYLLANGMMSAFKKIFTDGDGKGTFSARMEYVLNNIILALLENEGQTLLGVNRMLFDKEYRKFIVSNVTDPTVKDFWVNEYANYTDKTAQELAPAIQNKIGQFVSNPLIRNIVGQKKTSFDVRKIMDEKKIFIANLSKGKVGEGNANLLGSLLITKIYLAAMSRADVDPYEAGKLPPCYFYVDEFQNFANESFASILSEARKYKLALTVAHQYIEQMTDEVKSAVFGNVGTMITFRVGATDAEVFEKEFAPYFVLDDFVNLSAYQIYLRLMIDDQGSKPFSARTLPRIEKPVHSHEQSVIAFSRNAYAKQKFLVEEEIVEFYKPAPKVEKPKPENMSPEAKFLKVNEYKTESPYPPKRNERNEKSDREKNITRYDVPKKQPEMETSIQGGHTEISATVTETRKDDFVNNAHDTTQNIQAVPTQEIVNREENIPYVSEKIIRTQGSFHEKPVYAKREDPFTATRQPKDFYKKQEPRKDDGFVHSAPNRPTLVDTYRPEQAGEKSAQRERPRQGSVQFDDKPALSLKDALAKAMSERRESSLPYEKKEEANDMNDSAVHTEEKQTSFHTVNTATTKEFEKVEQTNPVTHQEKQEEKKRKEISEDVLRKLIEE